MVVVVRGERVVGRVALVSLWRPVFGASMSDAKETRGRFGLQVHWVGADATALEVRFWNLRVRELK